MWWAKVWSQRTSANVSFSLPCSSPAWLFLRAFSCALLRQEQITTCSKFLPRRFAPALQHTSSLETVCFLKQRYQLHLGSKPTSFSAILLYNWVLQTPNRCGWFSDFLFLVCFSISISIFHSCTSLPLVIIFWVPWKSQKLRMSTHQLSLMYSAPLDAFERKRVEVN